MTQKFTSFSRERASICLFVHRVVVSYKMELWFCNCLHLEVKCGLRRCTWVPGWQGVDCWLLFSVSLTGQRGFPDSSVGKESTCNAGDPGSIPGLGRSTGEGIGYPLQYSWSSLVAQLGKNLPAIQETWVWSLGLEDTLEKGKATHFSILA